MATFLYQTSGQLFNTSIAPKILPILQSNLWQGRDLSSSFEDFNLKFVNTCNESLLFIESCLRCRQQNKIIWGDLEMFNITRESESVRLVSDAESPLVVQNILLVVLDNLLIGLFWSLGAFDFIFDIQMLPHYSCVIWSNRQTNNNKTFPQHRACFPYFSDILVLL